MYIHVYICMCHIFSTLHSYPKRLCARYRLNRTLSLHSLYKHMIQLVCVSIHMMLMSVWHGCILSTRNTSCLSISPSLSLTVALDFYKQPAA